MLPIRRAKAPFMALLLALPLLPLAAPDTGIGAEPFADLNGDGFVVVAVVDTGINPYHEDFLARTHVGPAPLDEAPASYLTAYPAAAKRLDLSLDEASYKFAREHDAVAWADVKKDTLYHIPGTKIVGAYSTGDRVVGLGGGANDVLVLDEDGHGTMAAGVAVGNVHGACPSCLLVVVEGFGGIAWAAKQPWIDVVTNSWGPVGNLGFPRIAEGYERITRDAAERGQTHLFATGNGVENAFVTPTQTYTASTTGPSWILRVGGAVKHEDGSYRTVGGSGHPSHVVAQAFDVPAADPFNLTGTVLFSGTSASTPLVAGHLASLLGEARGLLGNPANGQVRKGVVAEGQTVPGNPFLWDGVLTRAELWSLVLHTAEPTRFSGVGVYPVSPPSTGAADAFLEGYGVVDNRTRGTASLVLRDETNLPARHDEAFVMDLDESLRDAVWGPWDRNGDSRRTSAFGLP